MKFSRFTLVSASLLLIACLSACAVRYEEGQTSTASSQQAQTINEEEVQKFTSQHSQKVVSKEVAESGGTSITFDDGTEYVHVSDTTVGEYYMLSYPSGCKVTYFDESGDYTVATDKYEGEEKASEATGQIGQYFVASGYSIAFANDGTLLIDLQGNFTHQYDGKEKKGNVKEAEGSSYVDSLLNQYGIPNLAFYDSFVKEAVADAKTYFTADE
ncbi:hypothetical protein EI999_04775 [Streptococcus suis]|uniref:hypothetical protein n=1 Tax=Streptococcus suis TaxID=1307 RepID=UPI000CF3E858|nr:hypothetical protein [Streptococcus suis]MEE3745328.1 hypothetical protein [Streptococcus suis]NQL70388.1 hypothetical protein [Streptococcus suis]RRR52177.1 hypothetical protein EI999_04775 [Streptococcus suis]HEL1767389.1 hypothetical protein [Streptococcus suis]HEL2244653.1 hypothetical protein [Streptococcus suis]